MTTDDKTNADDGFLTVAEAASAVRCCHETIRRLVRAGRVEAIRVGPRIRVRLTDVVAVLRARPGVVVPVRQTANR